MTSASWFGGGNGDGLNYYNDNNPPCGQTFTTGNNTQGYWLTNVTIATGGGGSSAPPRFRVTTSGSTLSTAARLSCWPITPIPASDLPMATG